MPVIPALAFICLSPAAVDGDTLRCTNRAELVRLNAIDAPELPGHCRRGRVCTEGDGLASKAALAALIAGRQVRCAARHRDTYGRLLARCSAEGAGDLSCAMVARGFAIERYARLRCGK
jgi:endonuclease YncB( thermonuclease family)